MSLLSIECIHMIQNFDEFSLKSTHFVVRYVLQICVHNYFSENKNKICIQI